ncbi:unnamed protein product [Trichogramma brassicae]|uniref:RNA-directed DNA polymerase n=1 Tax=Trichogramma brassicae TaxID=86971 RepID=A0A6H5IB52_9HYME|nr:unnamed protein product [Trichogramma brassicae]
MESIVRARGIENVGYSISTSSPDEPTGTAGTGYARPATRAASSRTAAAGCARPAAAAATTKEQPGEVAEPQVNAVGNCKLPAFWRGNPELYFFQVESLFHIHHVNSDATRYHMVVAMLDPDSITEVSDIIRVPPQEDKYNTLKQTLLRRLTDPPDVQLHQMLTGVELGDKRPSQLLLHMRTLAGSRVSDEILKVRWLDLLPEQTRRLLLLIKNQSLDELAAVADEAHAMGPSVMSAGYRSQQPTSAPSLSFAAGSPDPVAQELAELRLAIVQLTAITRESLQSGRSNDHRSNDHRSNNPRSRSRSRGRQESRTRAATPRVQAHAKVFAGTIRDMVRRRRICPGEKHLRVLLAKIAEKLEVLALYSTAGAGKNMERRLYIFDRGSNIRFLVDSGSVVSIVPRSFIRRPLQRQALRLQAANGTHDLNIRQLRHHTQPRLATAIFLAIYGGGRGHGDSRRRFPQSSWPSARPQEPTSARQQHKRIRYVFHRPNSTGTLYLCDSCLDSPRRPLQCGLQPAAQRRLQGRGRTRATRGSKEGVRRPLATRNYQAIFKPVGKPDPPRAQTRRKMARVTGDYRQLNARTRPDRHPLPIIEDLLQEINGRVFSVVDLRRAFYQIPVAEEDIPKTAVTTPFGLFEFVGMPLGLRNSAQSFQRAMNHLLRNLDYVKCYQDDILVLSSNHEEHLRHLRGLFDVLQRAKLHVNWDKCQIGRTHVIFAGYEISPDGFRRSTSSLSPQRKSDSQACVALQYFWPSLRKDVGRWAKQCIPCQLSKVHRHNRAELGKFTTPDGRFDHIHLDIVKMPMSQGCQNCLTIIDRYTRWPQAIPLADIAAPTVARALFAGWISLFGTPLTITTDQGGQFESKLLAELGGMVGAKHVHTTPYHPKGNGMVERMHRTLKARAQMLTTQTPWTLALPAVLLGLRTTFKEDLQASPSEMLFGTSLRIPGEFIAKQRRSSDDETSRLRRLSPAALAAMRPVPASRHVQHRPFVFKELGSCEYVLRRIDTVRKPLEPPYSGPHRVVRRIDDERTFVVDVNGVEKTLSTDQLKPAFLETQPMKRSLGKVNRSRDPLRQAQSSNPHRNQRQPQQQRALTAQKKSVVFIAWTKMPSPLGRE